MIDAVLSYHMNPQTCGVSKFNHELARRLGIPCLQIDSDDAGAAQHPLLSVKLAEMPLPSVDAWLWPAFDLLSHDEPTCMPQRAVVYRARRHLRAADIGCPSTINGNPHRGAYRVLVFGMAHKLNLPHFEALKEQLDRDHPDYTIELSTAVHEGNPWDEAITESVRSLRSIFGERLRVLGFLGDDALARTLQEVDAVAAYYQPALRANNTTYWAAVEAGKAIYTNRDELSPKPDDPPASWDRLVELLRA